MSYISGLLLACLMYALYTLYTYFKPSEEQTKIQDLISKVNNSLSVLLTYSNKEMCLNKDDIINQIDVNLKSMSKHDILYFDNICTTFTPRLDIDDAKLNNPYNLINPQYSFLNTAKGTNPRPPAIFAKDLINLYAYVIYTNFCVKDKFQFETLRAYLTSVVNDMCNISSSAEYNIYIQKNIMYLLSKSVSYNKLR